LSIALNAERSAETHVVFRVLRARSSMSCRVWRHRCAGWV